MSKLPTVAYGTFSWNPRYTRQSVIEVHRQDYPAELKTHFLMYQKPFPVHFTHCFPHKIVHINVTGPRWPGAWLYKMLHFTQRARADYLLLFDEDDMFDADYTRKALEPILSTAARISWNHKDTFMQRTAIWNGRYNSAIGTVCAERSLLKLTAKEMVRKYPKGGPIIKGGLKGPCDNLFRKMLVARYGNVVTKHDGVRYYFRHKGMITSRRNRAEDVDYGWDWANMRSLPAISQPGKAGKDWRPKA